MVEEGREGRRVSLIEKRYAKGIPLVPSLAEEGAVDVLL